MNEVWNKRYDTVDYIYGKAPNEFFATSLERYKVSGKMLFAAEGEGRNAVYAAQKGIDAMAFDISENAKNKALLLAKNSNVNIQYQVGDFMQMPFENESFDAVALIYAHFPPPLWADYYKKIAQLLKPDGLIILEGFSENNLALRQNNPKIGGPNDKNMLFSTEKITPYFKDFEILQLEETKIELCEGLLHNGLAKVIRFIGRKK